jgi:putative Mg2+ transporter-C (MgtC) family protein
MELNPPILVHWVDLDLLSRLGLAAVIGIACGAAQWPLVVIGALISLIMLTVLGFIERRWTDHKEHML